MENELKALKKKMILAKTTVESLRYEELTVEFVDKFIKVFEKVFDDNIECIDNMLRGDDNGK